MFGLTGAQMPDLKRLVIQLIDVVTKFPRYIFVQVFNSNCYGIIHSANLITGTYNYC